MASSHLHLFFLSLHLLFSTTKSQFSAFLRDHSEHKRRGPPQTKSILSRLLSFPSRGKRWGGKQGSELSILANQFSIKVSQHLLSRGICHECHERHSCKIFLGCRKIFQEFKRKITLSVYFAKFRPRFAVGLHEITGVILYFIPKADNLFNTYD